MCKIRVIFKRENDIIIKDSIWDFNNLEISPIDRPSYVTCTINNDEKEFCSYFLDKTEKCEELIVDNKLRFSYGIISGKINKLVTTHPKIHETTMFNSIQLLINVLGNRGCNNIKEYLKLYNVLLLKLNESLLLKIDEEHKE